MKQNINPEIEELIALRQEGGYWDFKREWYANDKKGKQDMLHDIICMANNLEGRDAYIIVGIDVENNYSLCMVDKDLNRRNTQNIVDFLREKKFAGGIRPTVSVETIEIDLVEIDVLLVRFDRNTPYY